MDEIKRQELIDLLTVDQLNMMKMQGLIFLPYGATFNMCDTAKEAVNKAKLTLPDLKITYQEIRTALDHIYQVMIQSPYGGNT